MSEKAQKALNELTDQIKQVSTLYSCMSLLGWDERTYMPRKGAPNRAEQQSMLAGMAHEKFTSKEIGDLISEVEASDLVKDPLSADAVNVREIRRVYDKQVKKPKSLVEEISKTTTLSEQAWVEARKKSDFPGFSPWLAKMIDLKNEEAESVGYEKEPYDALLDDYEPGETAENITKVFADLRGDLVPLVEAVANAPKKPDVSILEREYDVDRQAILGKAASAAIGFDYDSGRLDITTHPFCTTIGSGDVRITTRYNRDHFAQAFFGIMHETGHGLYEQGLDPQYSGLPMGDSISLGIHESQSRMWENIVGRSKPFWKYFFPRARQVFWEALSDVKLDDFYFAINDVRPSLIRVEADEATYNLHILLRFEIEHAIFNKELKTDDIPGIWNEKFQKYFGITPPNDAQGCLQDVHWGAGLIGYFPTYTLGNLYSAQFYAKAEEELGNLDEEFSRGHFDSLLGWLRDKIHKHGQRYRAEDLVKQVTGKPLSHEYLLKYLKDKYAPIYGI
ncbi:MAG: carboxypeptidase M32 [candidate division Zixibacteria bacterium]|nr:carboxypeptidase M32 [candidate division Zixibacteria bacterium]